MSVSHHSCTATFATGSAGFPLRRHDGGVTRRGSRGENFLYRVQGGRWTARVADSAGVAGQVEVQVSVAAADRHRFRYEVNMS